MGEPERLFSSLRGSHSKGLTNAIYVHVSYFCLML